MKVYTVSAINKIIQDILDNEVMFEDIVVTGELSSFSVTRNIAYFTLKENDNLLSCVQFKAKQNFNIGDMVEVRGNIKYYTKGGKLSLNALSIKLCGQGDIYQQFLKLKSKLQEEGLFDESNKIPIPRFINSIGVVTSETGAVLQDIKNVTSRRNPNLEIYVYDAQVQGKMAVQDIIQGITYFDNLTDVDVIIVARHETDFSILDFVADLRAPTPSAAAELVTFDCLELKRYIKDLQAGLTTNVSNQIAALSNEVNMSVLSIEKDLNDIINDESLYILDKIKYIEKNVETKLDNTTYCVNLALNTLEKLNPLKILRSGYSYATIKNETINYNNIKVGDEINLISNDVKINAEIKNKEKYKC